MATDPRLEELRSDDRKKYVLDDRGNVVLAKYADEIVDEAPDGLTAVLRALVVSGPSHKLHRKAKADLHVAWPTLALALDRLLDEEMAKRLG
jgi:hypothetical protein